MESVLLSEPEKHRYKSFFFIIVVYHIFVLIIIYIIYILLIEVDVEEDMFRVFCTQ